MIAYVLAVWLGAGGFTAVAALAPSGQDPPVQAAPEKKPKKPKKADKAPKDPERAKVREPKKPKSDQPAPDEIDDPDAEIANGPGIGFVWKSHPSFRFGENFRLDFEAKLQEDAHGSYAGATGLNCPGDALPTPCTFQLHRNRVGIRGNLFRKVQYEVERELTEQELSNTSCQSPG